ncbi:hypothetical protein FQA47_014704 [Oryzias melastigma]|uniref:Uncharacterized protein n=1 Tax=Oryzias melastigma TaxID=30732 RepID=A0A834C6N4_ORYME|nr:hypothetical protein FQA47_014704 [Oryzias melastigma]
MTLYGRNGKNKEWRRPACCSPPLSAPPVQSCTLKSDDKYERVQEKLVWYLEGFRFDPSRRGVLAVHASRQNSLETRGPKKWLCSFEHSTFTLITFDLVQRNLTQPALKQDF